MSFFRKKGPYTGPVVFANDGAHYPLKFKRVRAGAKFPLVEDGPDRRQRVLWDVELDGFRWATPTDLSHRDHFHEAEVTLRISD